MFIDVEKMHFILLIHKLHIKLYIPNLYIKQKE